VLELRAAILLANCRLRQHDVVGEVPPSEFLQKLVSAVTLEAMPNLPWRNLSEVQVR
jgi:hypothetical protein